MSNYDAIIAAIEQQTKAYEEALPLRSAACRSRFFPASPN